MNWTELVAAVAQLSPDEQQRLLDEARRLRSAEDAIPAEAPVAATTADPAPTTDPAPAVAPSPVADILRPNETPSANWSFAPSSAAAPLGTPSGLPRDDGVPTMDEIREKIEGRFARAEGQAILDAESKAGQHRVDDEQARAKAAEEVLAKIRASINKP